MTRLDACAQLTTYPGGVISGVCVHENFFKKMLDKLLGVCYHGKLAPF